MSPKAARTVSMAARYSSMTSCDSISITSCLYKVIDRLFQRLPEFQFQVQPFVLGAMPKGDGIGGAGKLSRKVLERGVRIPGGAGVVTHEGSLRCNKRTSLPANRRNRRHLGAEP